jgi:DNA-binding response OmpR family regulator
LSTNRTVLVIDDEVHIRRAIELKLKNAGYTILSATDGAEGLAAVHASNPDAVIADIQMPRMDGKTLCERTDPLKRERPFLTVMLTGRISPDERLWVDRMTDTVFMEKPFSPSRLLAVVDQYFGIER